MSRRGAKAALAALAALALLVTVLVARPGGGGPEAARDGEGVLASANDPAAHEAMAVDPNAWGGPWTFGLRLCLARGSDAAMITSVSGATTVGSGFRVLGVQVRDWIPTSTDTPIISVDQYPVATRAILHDAIGFAVTQPCPPPGAMPQRYTELDIGFARIGTDGGGWRGIDIGYTVGGSPMVVRLNHDLLVCGASVAVDCAGPPGATAAS